MAHRAGDHLAAQARGGQRARERAPGGRGCAQPMRCAAMRARADACLYGLRRAPSAEGGSVARRGRKRASVRRTPASVRTAAAGTAAAATASGPIRRRSAAHSATLARGQMRHRRPSRRRAPPATHRHVTVVALQHLRELVVPDFSQKGPLWQVALRRTHRMRRVSADARMRRSAARRRRSARIPPAALPRHLPGVVAVHRQRLVQRMQHLRGSGCAPMHACHVRRVNSSAAMPRQQLRVRRACATGLPLGRAAMAL
jgi:hypothetical protein